MAAKQVVLGGLMLLILLMHLLLNIDSRINWINTKGQSVSRSPFFCYLPLLLVAGSRSVYVILSNPTSKKGFPGHLAATFFPIALGYIFFCQEKEVVLSQSTIFSDKKCFLFPLVN